MDAGVAAAAQMAVATAASLRLAAELAGQIESLGH